MVVITGYEIIEQIYDSGNSVVYRGRREQDNQPVILKILKQDYLNTIELTRYKQEYEITRNFKHNGIIKAYDLQSENFLMMILEDFGGESLNHLLFQNKFSLLECLEIACKITDSLAQIHAAQVIHKDINPSNIIFNRVTKQLKIIDFGISTQLGSQHTVLSSPNALEGTLAYISPEQTGRMNRSLDYRTDFYSLGVTLYELFVNQLPFVASDAMELIHCHLAKQPIPPQEINSQIPQMISRIAIKLMAKTPEERYQSVWGIKADLENCLLQLKTNQYINHFDLAQEDISHKFYIPEVLRLAACIGNHFTLNTLAIVSKITVVEAFQYLAIAIQQGLILATSGLDFVDDNNVDSQLVIYNSKFLHDRVQQAAYSLIPDYEKKPVHLQICSLLDSTLSTKEKTEAIFELVDHLNLARELIIDSKEKLELVKLNLSAAKKAKDSIAYQAPANYFRIAMQELPENSWFRNYELTLDIYRQLAELEYLNGNFEESECLINLIIQKVRTPEEKADINISSFFLNPKFAKPLNNFKQHYTNSPRYSLDIDTVFKASNKLLLTLPI